MGKAIAIFNQKGGVGKTTTNINLAACLANRGKKVLMVDIDPQGNTTSGIGIRKRTLKTTLYDCLIDETFDVRKAILPTNTENLFIIPASVDLAGAEVELAQLEARERRLRGSLTRYVRIMILSSSTALLRLEYSLSTLLRQWTAF